MHDQPAADTLTWDHAILFTGVDDALDRIIHPLVDLIITIRAVDCEQPQDAYLDTVVATNDDTYLHCRHINEHCQPVGDIWTVPVTQLAHIHIW